MAFEFYAARFGAPAAAMLRALVTAEQAADPFAPVTVVVPDNLTGVMARRGLAAAGGFVHVSFVTPATLAERLCGSPRPLAGPLEVGAAVRDVLARETSGIFAPVAAHPATEVALAAAHRTLAGAAPDTVAALATSPSVRTRAVVALHRRVAARLGAYEDEHARARRAVERIRARPAVVDPLGAIVVHLVDDLAPALADLVTTIAEHRRVAVVVGVTGEPAADLAAQWWAHHAGATALEHLAPVPPLAATSSTFTATDADDEVRHAVRLLCARAEAGVPLARMALLYPAPEPYARLVHEHLDAAGLAHNGPAVRTLGGMVAGRAALGLLALAAGRWSRAEVVDLAAEVPGVVDGVARPVAAWDSVSRAAGVVGGLADWEAKLSLRLVAARSDAERTTIRELQAFVDALAAHVGAGAACTTWPQLAAWLVDTVRWFVGDPASWPAAERHALEAVCRTIDGTGRLGPLDRRPSLDALARALTTALDVPSQRVGTLGVGVLCGPLEHARALDADIVVVVGLAEGLCPAPRRDDTLLPDTERRRAHLGELALASSRVGEQQRALLAAYAAARVECVRGYPRGDHRGGRARVPSRWLDRADFAAPEPPTWHVASYEAGLRDAPTAAHATEQRLRVLRACAPAARATHPVTPPALARGIHAITARASGAFTEWDANLASRTVPSPTTTVLSPTRLEAWATCPFRYFATTLLGLGERDTPEAVDQVSALDRGSLLHRVLERFVGEALDAPPAPHERWSAAAVARLHDIATEEFALAEARGRTGPAVRWRRDQFELRQALDAFVAADDARRAGYASTPAAVELAFGLGGQPPLEVTLRDGRTLSFRGLIDRVDRTADGLVVFDYKTGSTRRFRGLDAANPVIAGAKLQLPLYALAAQRALPAERVAAYYAFLDTGQHLGYAVDADVLARVDAVFTEMVDGIEGGVFLARSGEYNAFFGTHESCGYCAFDRMCSPGRADHWAAKSAGAPEGSPLARYRTLAEEPS